MPMPGERMTRPSSVVATLLVLASAAVLLGAAGGGGLLPAGPSPFDWRVAFKAINFTAHAGAGQVGYLREGDATRETDELSLRVQFKGKPASWLDYRFDYLNVKDNLGFAVPAQAGGAELFRRKPLRWSIYGAETAPGQTPSTQTVRWYHEVDDAYVRLSGGPMDATLGRQPITWGVGRIWQPTDLFATFSPTALDTEYKPGVDGLLLNAYPSAFSTVQLAYILSPQSTPDVPNSTALRWRTQVGEVSELTLLGASVRGEHLGGGSFEMDWLQAGWRVEGIAFHPPDRSGTAVYAIAGVDRQLSDGTILLGELYHNTLGARSEGEIPAVLQSQAFQQGRLLQLSRSVLGMSASRDFLGLWNGAYTLFLSPLRDAEGTQHVSLLHVLTFTYSVSDNASAVFSLQHGSGRGLGPGDVPRSDFGAVPNSLYVSLQFVL